MKALIVVDIQNDFLEGGSLAVPDGNAIIPVANRLMRQSELVVATQDWHPLDHASFAANHPGHQPFDCVELHGLAQTLWPVHCVENTNGAALASSLESSRIKKVFRKGTRKEIDSYSGFYDNGGQHGTGLAEWLREQGVTHVSICGLATDYCVKFTALDALKEGFHTTLVLEACRGVNIQPDDIERAIHEMRNQGAVIA